jgi:hypothetical protein
MPEMVVSPPGYRYPSSVVLMINGAFMYNFSAILFCPFGSEKAK